MNQEQDITPITSSCAVPPVPVMQREKFAELAGIDIGVVSAWIDRGYLPTIKIGKYRLVNIAALTKEALDQEITR